MGLGGIRTLFGGGSGGTNMGPGTVVGAQDTTSIAMSIANPGVSNILSATLLISPIGATAGFLKINSTIDSGISPGLIGQFQAFPFAELTSSIFQITGTTLQVPGSTLLIQVNQSSGTTSGYLSFTDWNTFNNKVTSLGPFSYVPFAQGATIFGPTFQLGVADATNPGGVGTTNQTWAGIKTFNASPILNSLGASLPLQIDGNKQIYSGRIDLTTGVTGILSVPNGGTGRSTALLPGSIFYVDNNRTDTYTADGTPGMPFKTIAAALAQVISNNNALNYTIIVASGDYTTEDITLNNAAFTRIAIVASSVANGQLSADAIPVTSIRDIISTSNNDGLRAILISGFVFRNLSLIGATTGSNFCQYGSMISNCIQLSSATVGIDVENAGEVVFADCGFSQGSGSGNVTVQNVNDFLVYKCLFSVGAMSIITNAGLNKPSGFSSTTTQFSFGSLAGTISIDAGSTLNTRWNRVLATISCSGTMNSIMANFRSAVTINLGGTWTTDGDIVNAAAVPTVAGTLSFTGNLYASGARLGSLTASLPVLTDANKNLISGSVVNLGPFSYTSFAQGATLNGTTFQIGWADGTNPGSIGMTHQTFGNGIKTFQAPVLGYSGLVTSPAFSFTGATTMGFYISGVSNLGVAVGGVLKAYFSPNGLELPTALSIRFQDTTGGEYAEFKAASTTTTYSNILPAAQGATYSNWQNDGQGNITWAPAKASQLSSSCGIFSTASTSFVDATNLTCTITASGTRPVLIVLVPDGAGNTSFTDITATANTASGQHKCDKDNGTDIGQQEIETSATLATNVLMEYPVGSINFIDPAPTAGSHTYKIQSQATSGTTIRIIRAKLFVYET